VNKIERALLALVVGTVGAIGSASAAPCAPASLSAYAALGSGGCTVGSLTFSDFVVEAFPGPTATQIAPASILVAPVANGFSLSSANILTAAAETLLGLRFLFDVTGPSITGGTVALGSDRTVSGDGVITGLLDAGSAGNAIAIATADASDTPASFVSSPAAFFDVFFELGIDGGTTGSASLGASLATLTFDAAAAPIPEPSVAALSLLGLIALLAQRRWRNPKRV
jgi:hypothetical protein